MVFYFVAVVHGSVVVVVVAVVHGSVVVAVLHCPVVVLVVLAAAVHTKFHFFLLPHNLVLHSRSPTSITSHVGRIDAAVMLNCMLLDAFPHLLDAEVELVLGLRFVFLLLLQSNEVMSIVS